MSVAFQVYGNFKLYSGGVYTSDSCGSDPMVRYFLHFIIDWFMVYKTIRLKKNKQMCVNDDFWQDVNHAVVAVGYGVEDGIPYWLIKNSWGADWGLNGYFKMEMGKNMCGMSLISHLFSTCLIMSYISR